MTSKQWFSVLEAASYKGFKYDTFLYYVKNGRGPAYEMVGGRKLYTRAALDAWDRQRDRRGRKAKP